MTTAHDPNAEPRSDAVANERRRTPRLQVYGAIEVQLHSIDAPVTLRDVSLGGFSIESELPIMPDAVHRVRFVLDDSAEIELSARSSHCRRGRTSRARAQYITGFSFIVSASGGSRQAVELLVDRLAGVLSFKGV